MQLYVLSLKLAATSSYGALALVRKPQLADPPRCDGCGADLSPRRTLPPHRYLIKYGDPGDLLTDVMITAFSSRFMKAYKESDLVGLEFDDKLELKNSKLDYRMAWPVCTYALMDESASGVVINNVRGCDKCRVMSIKKIDRIVLKENTWGGEDIFRSGNLFGLILVSQRFVDCVRSNGFTNFQFIRQDEYSESFDF